MTEHPAFQITAVVDRAAQELVCLRMASAVDVVAAVESGLDWKGRMALDRILASGRLSDKDLTALKAAAGPGLFVEEMSNAVFLWIADNLVPKYRIAPVQDNLASPNYSCSTN